MSTLGRCTSAGLALRSLMWRHAQPWRSSSGSCTRALPRLWPRNSRSATTRWRARLNSRSISAFAPPSLSSSRECPTRWRQMTGLTRTTIRTAPMMAPGQVPGRSPAAWEARVAAGAAAAWGASTRARWALWRLGHFGRCCWRRCFGRWQWTGFRRGPWLRRRRGIRSSFSRSARTSPPRLSRGTYSRSCSSRHRSPPNAVPTQAARASTWQPFSRTSRGRTMRSGRRFSRSGCWMRRPLRW
mmetsp:Transcript_39551/g.93691  ORF Transcript_39551/g.93691 Transcript_39551/m.93691 type:complete len:242 (-) Transcript_39551:126-851(-)